jgi:hypothetical protein
MEYVEHEANLQFERPKVKKNHQSLFNQSNFIKGYLETGENIYKTISSEYLR